MKSFTLIVLLAVLLLANFASAITLNYSDLIPLDKIDLESISSIVEALENATNAEKQAALHKAVKGTILEVNFLVRISIHYSPSNSADAAQTEADTYHGSAEHEAGAFDVFACTTNKKSPLTWKIIWAAFILGAKPGLCKMNWKRDCTQFVDYQGAHISVCGNPSKYDLPCNWVMSYSLSATTQCTKKYGGISRAAGKYIFGLHWGKIPGAVVNH
jgi:hypothetical protein